MPTAPLPLPRNRRAASLIRLLATLRRCDQSIIRCESEHPLFDQLCQDFVALQAFDFAWVALADAETESARTVACAGEAPAHITTTGQAGAALHSQAPQWCTDLPNATERQACAVLPLMCEGQAVGVLGLYAHRPQAMDPNIKALLVETAANIGCALDHFAQRRRRERAEAEARQAQRLTQAFIDHLPGTAFLKDADLRLLMANRHLARSLDLPIETLIGRNNHDLFPPDFAESADALDRAVLHSGASQTVPQTFGDRHLETRLFVVDGGENRRLLGGISLDVTDQHHDRQRTEALLALQEMAVRLDERPLLTQGLETVERLTHSAIGFLHFVNQDQETLELVTWTGGALRGCTAAYDNHYPISSAGVWADCFRNRGPVVVNDYAALPHKHGLPPGHAPLLRFVSVPVIEGQRVCMMLGVGNKATDYTQYDVETLQLIGYDLWRVAQRGRAEKALQQRLNELQTVNAKLADMQLHLLQTEKMASIGQLAAGVAHEINNPIGFVRSNLGTLARYVQDLIAVDNCYQNVENRLGDAHREAFEPVHALKADTDHSFVLTELPDLIAESQDGIERVRKIVLDLKNFSRTGDTDWQWADLTQGLESTINMVWNQIKYKAELLREYQDLPQVYCVASQINQVVMNLLVNAAQAIEQRGTITVRTRADEHQVWIEVQDSGCGITPEQQKRIFEPFYTTKAPGQGTGLGLSIAWRVMERHHGQIEIESEPGQGSLFRLRLPIDHRQTAP